MEKESENGESNQEERNQKEPASDVNNAPLSNPADGRSTPDQKKKIPVESLGKDELVQQCKKQMLLLQKMKARYDDLQQKHTDLTQQHDTCTQLATEHQSVLRRVSALEADLKSEREIHRKTKEQVARLSQHSVAELEIRDYTRTIDQLNEKLTVKDNCLVRATEQLHKLEKQVEEKDAMINEQDSRIMQLAERCSELEVTIVESRKECLEREREIGALRDDAIQLKEQMAALEGKMSDQENNQSEIVKNHSELQKNLEVERRLVAQKNTEISRLTVDLSHTKTQHEHILKDFEEYKVRAQALLKQQKGSSDRATHQKELDELTGRIMDLDAEITTLKIQNEDLSAELSRERLATEAGKRSSEAERIRWENSLLECEERIRALDYAKESAHQDYRKTLRLHESEMSALKDLHASTNHKLLEEMRALRQENESLRHNQRPATPVEKPDSTNDPPLRRSESLELNDVFDTGAPDAESSGSSELPSFHRTISVSASEIVAVPPLEKLIAIPPSSADQNDHKRMKHLSELLHESENTNVRLSEQIKVLKHELRRTESNTEREKHAGSMEYLKNVLMKFLTHRVAQAEQEKLIEVMTTILKLTVEERQQLAKAGAASYIPENVRAWGAYLNPWKGKES
ncbi:GRIP and coiled-coil domain-containing protein 2-like [Paramacrobiotus metropolitanus]|uniref:GRIP and coiled-coil domain-containing protein 2-like n=1 Tax=Paramacrobiotus metropolitanus TaxID=2943436 RepID=UPI0024464B1E|nr:GRIP and coiled-coil domain-containing protein 2-like [Paramacrobiotus metropolitanus]